MYKKNEIFKIFESVTTFEELTAVCDTFRWLLEKGFQEPTEYLFEKSLEAFTRVT